VELLGATSDHAEALDLIADLKPDVVMVEVAEGDQSDCEETISILQVSPRVICLSLDNNEMKIYQRHDRMMTNVEDLFSLINESGIDGHPRGLDT
jgi:DNA-binding NarL/FixJ family response regulator